MAVTREEEDANEPGREATWKATLWRTLFLPCHDCIPATKGSREGQGMLETWQWNTVIFSTLLKLSLLPSYHSTDFEVHRNWLAITNTVPISQWYFDQTSQWTLDYPPFFAYFSWILSVPAKLWDSRIVDLKGGLEYDDWKCVLYMRLSVIITEFILAGALFALSRQPSANPSISKVPAVVAAALLLHPGLIIVDHIHFQYNGFLFGILLWSVWAAREGRPLLCAFLFSTLLNFKHIYIYIAPAYFIFLLQSYVVKGSGSSSLHSGPAERLFTLGITTLTPFALSVIPLALSGFSGNSPASPVGILSQMLSRLFPFSRGLNHAYWAANIWSLYTFADRVLVKLLPATPIDDLSATASRGIIGDTRFTFLPQIAAGHCFILTTIFTAIFSIRLFIKPTQTSFLQAITLFGLTSFLFGFHVHEKAILLALIPLTLLAPLDYFYIRMTLLLSTSGIIALFPLLFQVKETPIKYIYSILWSLVTFRAMFAFHFRPTPSNWDLLLSYLENIYLVGFVPLQVFVSVVHPLYMAGNLNPLVEKAAAAVTASTSATEAVASVVSASASQASASISVLAAGISMGPQFNDTLSPSTFSDLLTSAGEAVSSNGKAAQDIVATAIESIVEVAKGAVSAKPSEAPSTAMEFLPLMLTSVYCALGVTFVWIRLGYRFLTFDEEALNQTHIKVTSSTPSRKAR